MTWIKTTPPEGSQKKLREIGRMFRTLYPAEYGAEVPALEDLASADAGGGISNAHALIPDALFHIFSTHGTLLSPELPLNRRQHEMIALVVSVINDCFY